MADGLSGFPVFLGVALYLWLHSMPIFYVVAIILWWSKKGFSEAEMVFIIIMVILPNIPLWGHGGSQSYFYWAVVSFSSFCMAAIMVLRRNSFVGLPLHFFGTVSNGLVLIVNGLRMPVAIDMVQPIRSATHVPMNAFTSLNFLGDWIPFPGVIGFFSPGDLFMALGAFIAFIEALRIKRGA